MAYWGQSGWTDSRVALLKRLWGEGESASQIAKKIGGVTRNAVIGKVHRLGLAGRALPNKQIRTRAPRDRKARMPAPPRALVQPAAVRRQSDLDAIRALPPLVLANGFACDVLALDAAHCRFPCGDPGEPGFAFCGRTPALGPYCGDHARLCYGDGDAAAQRALRREEKRRAEGRLDRELKRAAADPAFATMR